MTDPGETLMSRAELERAFAALGDRLARRGVVADLFVVRGAAMALAYDANRVTRDVDAVFVPHGVVVEESRVVAGELGLIEAGVIGPHVDRVLPLNAAAEAQATNQKRHARGRTVLEVSPN